MLDYRANYRAPKMELLAIRYHDDIFQKGKLEVADEMLSPDFVIRDPVLPEDLRRGPEGTKKYASAVITAVPDRKLYTMIFFQKEIRC